MSIRIALWCKCGGGMTAKSNPETVAQNIAASFRQVHVEDGCEVTDDPTVGKKWRAAARRREDRSVSA